MEPDDSGGYQGALIHRRGAGIEVLSEGGGQASARLLDGGATADKVQKKLTKLALKGTALAKPYEDL